MMMKTIYRDLGFFIVALVFYDCLLYKGIIHLYEAVLLVMCFLLYVVTIVIMNRWSSYNERDDTSNINSILKTRHQDEEPLNNLSKSEIKE